ncbi:MAG: amino acid permease [Ostreibacterium sp.]
MIKHKVGSVTYKKMDDSYFKSRELKRHAGAWSLWALGVGGVISGHFSGWNLGLASGGWGGMLIATILIAIMYIGLTQSVAEMSPALPHTGGAYSFARSAMGPWGGFITGLVENMEFIITPAVIVFFISAYMSSIFNTSDSFMPIWWLLFYIAFTLLNIMGAEMSFKFAVIVTLMALGCLLIFWVSAFALGNLDFNQHVLNIAADAQGKATLLKNGGGDFLPFGFSGAMTALPFAVWLFLAIEQMPLAAEESVDPKKDMPKGLGYGMLTLIISAFMILWLNSAVVGAYQLSSAGDPLLDGYALLFKSNIAKGLGLIVVIGLVASFHTIMFAYGRQIYSLSRAGYFPLFLSKTHSVRKTPHFALILGSTIGFVVLMIVWFIAGSGSSVFVGGALISMAVFSAMLSYILQSISFLLLRKKHPDLERPYVSPLGKSGAYVTMIIALVTIYFQLQDPAYRIAVISAAAYLIIGVIYFAIEGRNRLILSLEEKFALAHSHPLKSASNEDASS